MAEAATLGRLRGGVAGRDLSHCETTAIGGLAASVGLLGSNAMSIRERQSEDLQDEFALHGVTFINPFHRRNNRLIDEILPLPFRSPAY